MNFTKIFLIILFFYISVSKVVAFDIATNAPIPKILLPTISGNTGIVDIQSHSQGKAYMICFMFLGNRSSAAIINWYKDLLEKTDNNLNIYVIAMDKNLNTIPIQKFVGQKNLVILSDIEQQIAKQMHVLIIPTTFLMTKTNLLYNIYIDFTPSTKEIIKEDLNHL